MHHHPLRDQGCRIKAPQRGESNKSAGINMRHNQGDLIHMSSKHDPGPGSFLSCNQVAYAICINLITHLLQHGGEQIPDWRFVTRCTRCPDNFGKEIEIYHSYPTLNT